VRASKTTARAQATVATLELRSTNQVFTHWPFGKNSLIGTLGGSVCFTGPLAAAAAAAWPPLLLPLASAAAPSAAGFFLLFFFFFFFFFASPSAPPARHSAKSHR
jgi:hypothetical protein